MDVSNSEGNEMLLLMNQATLQKTQESGTNVVVPENYVHLTSSYDPQQFVIQNNCEMDMESLDDLLASQGISLENSDLSVIEQDGRQYILLPNVSVAQVLENTDMVTSQYNNATLRCDQSLPTATISSAVNGPVFSLATITPPSDVVDIQAAPEVPSTTPIVPKISQTAGVTPNLMDINRIVPSLCPKYNEQNQYLVQLVCPVCNFQANSEMALDEHMKAHRELGFEKNMKKSKSLSIRKIKGRKKKSTCRFIRTEPFPANVKKGPFLCSICGIQLPMISVYKRHMKAHMNDKEFKCSHCSESFNIEDNLKLHQALHADFSEQHEGGYSCPACQRTFMRAASLKAHLPIHFQDEGMICSECGDEFTYKSELTLHMQQHKIDLQTHMEERSENMTSYQIDDMFNADESSLLSSGSKKKRSRKKATPQHCMFCDKVFQKESLFKRHVLVHTGEKPYSCSVCNKTFNQASALKIHQLIHTGEKPFSCPHCPQVFNQRGNLRVHLSRAHAPTNVFTCHQCSCTFHKLFSLNAHVTKYHNKSSDVIAKVAKIAGDVESVDDVTQTSSTEGDASKEVDVIQQLLSTLDDADLKEAQEAGVSSDIVEQALQNCGMNQNEDNSEVPAIVNNGQGAGSFNIDKVRSSDFTFNGHTAIMTNHLQPGTGRDTDVIGSDNTMDLDDINDIGSEENKINNASGTVTEQQRASVRDDPQPPPGVYMHMTSCGPEQEVSWRVRRVNGVRWHQCMYCTKEFKKPSDLVRHIRTHTNERPFTCKTCKKSFAVKTTLAVHEKIHLGYKPFKCQVCSKSFSTSGSLKTHHRLHTGARPFKCNQCDKKFRTTGHRHQHIQSHLRGTFRKRIKKTKKANTAMILSSQQSEFHTDTPLQEPIRLNEDGLPIPDQENNENPASDEFPSQHVCSVCQKGFKKACHLQEHMRIHTGVKPYICTQCGSSFATASILKAHLLVHTGFKPFRCTKCTQSFPTRFSLNRHMTIHSPSRTFMCPYCRKTFKTNATCKKHIKLHKKDANQPAHISHPNNVDMSQCTMDPNALFNLDVLNPPTSHDMNKQFINDQVNTLSTDCMDPTTAAQVESVSNSIDANIELSNDVLQFHATAALEQVDLGVVSNALSHFDDDSSVLDSVAMATSQQQQDSQSADVDLSNQYYQVDQLLNFKCSGCSKYFETKAHLQRHEQELDLKKTSYPCTICCHSLESLASLTSHVDSHSRDVVHRCPICCVGFSDVDTSISHKESHDAAANTLLQNDDVTPEPTSGKDKDAPNVQLDKKKRSTRKRNGFYRLSKEQNDILEKTDPNQKMSLSERILLDCVAEKGKVSLAQKPGTRGRYKPPETNGPLHENSCNLCPKSFRKKCDLVRHIRTHTGDKPFKCKTCDKCFTVKSGLTCHEKIHLNTKTFRCHICDIFYASKTSLKVHMRLHTGTTPYKCPHCPAMFRAPNARKHHITSHFDQPNDNRKASKRSNSRAARAKTSTSLPSSSATSTAFTSSLNTSTTSLTSTMTVTSSCTNSPSKMTSSHPLVWPDMTFTVPMESIINQGLMQDADSLQVPVQMQVPDSNVRIEGTNITLQIDPLLLQSIQEGQATMKLAPSVQNMVLQPVSHLCLQPIANAEAELTVESTNNQTGKIPLTANSIINPSMMQTEQHLLAAVDESSVVNQNTNMVVNSNDILNTGNY